MYGAGLLMWVCNGAGPGALPRLVAWLAEGRYEPPALSAPTLRVDTTADYVPTFETIVAFIQAIRRNSSAAWRTG
jgi:hypothetical protein